MRQIESLNAGARRNYLAALLRIPEEEKMEGLIRKGSKLVGLAGAVLALSLLAGCSSNEPSPEQRAVNAANQVDQAAARADAAAQKSAASAAQAQAAASRVEQAASDAKAAADRAEAIASKTIEEHHPMHHFRHHRAAAAAPAPDAGAAPADSGAPAPAPATP